MPSGGLLRDPSQLFSRDAVFQQKTIVQVSVCLLLVILSAFYHFVLRGARPKGWRDEDVAEVDSILVYPIKSCRGVSLDRADISRKGFKYDRRWLVVAREGPKMLSLREEPRLTLIVPSFEGDMMRLHLSEHATSKLPDISIQLDPSEATTSAWQLLPPIDFYGSPAQGRVVESAQIEGKWKGSPSDWVSEFLGYPVALIQFDPQASKREPFPIYKPPFDLDKWHPAQREELKQHTDIEFQDEYPFLVSTRESLDGLNMQLTEALASPTPKAKVNKEYWSQKEKERGVKMQTFRPNIVLRTRSGQTPFSPFSEDSWETVWIQNEHGSLPIHLVARCKRCLLTAVDPETAYKDVNVPLGLLRQSRYRVKKAEGESGRKGPCFGIYGVPEKSEGTYTSICVGDRVRVRWRPLHLDDEVASGTRES